MAWFYPPCPGQAPDLKSLSTTADRSSTMIANTLLIAGLVGLAAYMTIMRVRNTLAMALILTILPVLTTASLGNISPITALSYMPKRVLSPDSNPVKPPSLSATPVVVSCTGKGSSFVVDERHVITAAHVVAGSHSVYLIYRNDSSSDNDGLMKEAQVVAVDKEQDIALLRVSRDKTPTDSLPLSSIPKYGRLKMNKILISTGFPEDKFARETRTYSSYVHDEKEQVVLLRTKGPAPGESGSPLLSENGVVGMILATGSNHSLAVNGDKLQRFYRKNNFKQSPANNTMCADEAKHPLKNLNITLEANN